MFTSSLLGQLVSFRNDWLQLLKRSVDKLNNILINVLGTVNMFLKFALRVWYRRSRQRYEMVHFFVCHPVEMICRGCGEVRV